MLDRAGFATQGLISDSSTIRPPANTPQELSRRCLVRRGISDVMPQVFFALVAHNSSSPRSRGVVPSGALPAQCHRGMLKKKSPVLAGSVPKAFLRFPRARRLCLPRKSRDEGPRGSDGFYHVIIGRPGPTETAIFLANRTRTPDEWNLRRLSLHQLQRLQAAKSGKALIVMTDPTYVHARRSSSVAGKEPARRSDRNWPAEASGSGKRAFRPRKFSTTNTLNGLIKSTPA